MLQPFDSMAFLCDNVWKRINNLKCGQRSGRGFAVPLQNLGISNGMRSCLKAKHCEGQLGFASDNPLTLLNNICLIPVRYSDRFLQSHSETAPYR